MGNLASWKHEVGIQLIWFLFIVMTVAALAYVFLPVLRTGSLPGDYQGDVTTHSHELEVYKDQLGEVDRDVKIGVISKTEAESAKLEISRRMLASAEKLKISTGPVKKSPDARKVNKGQKGKAGKKNKSGIAGRANSLVTGLRELGTAKQAGILSSFVIVPAMTFGLYAKYGSPHSPDLPYAGRLAQLNAGTAEEKAKKSAEARKIEDLMAKVEQRLQEFPNDGKGWDVIGPVYFSRGKYHKAAFAFRRAAQLLGENAQRLSGFAEATTIINKGKVIPIAAAAYKRALKIDPDLVEPRIRLAMGLEQDGKLPQAAAAYTDIIKRSDKNAPWIPIMQRRLGFVTAQLKGSIKGATGGKGPTAEDVKNATAMSGNDRNAMINQMVANLAGRLEENGQDLGGWLKLLNAYSVLGKKDDASKALGKARKIFKDDVKAMGQLKVAANRLGLK